MKNNIFEEVYLNTVANEEPTGFNEAQINDHINSLNEILTTIESRIISIQKQCNDNPNCNEEENQNLQIGLDSINKIKQNLLEITQQTVVLTDSLSKF